MSHKNAENDEDTRGESSLLGGVLNFLQKGAAFSIEGLEKLTSGSRKLRAPLNAVFGDRLEAAGSKLALPFQLLTYTQNEWRVLELENAALRRDLEPARERLCVLIHGLASSEKTWRLRRKAEERPAVYGELLARDAEQTCVFTRYNTGRHISQNGRELSELLEKLVAAYPGKLSEINLIGHSMGGLVSRSAAYYGELSGAKWVKLVKHCFLLGSPLLGAHQEQIGKLTTDILNVIPNPGTRITARVIDLRSNGIQDLGFGYLRDEDWNSEKSGDLALANKRLPVPLLKHAHYHLIIGALSKDPDGIIGSFLGDGVVNITSARGQARTDTKYETYGDSEPLQIAGLSHTKIPGDPRVYRRVRDILREG